MRYTGRRSAALLAAFLVACGGGSSQRAQTTTPEAQAAPSYAGLPRLRFNQLAMRLNLPLFWAADADEDGAVDPDEVRALLFYPTDGRVGRRRRFTPEFGRAYRRIMAAADAPAPDDERAAAGASRSSTRSRRRWSRTICARCPRPTARSPPHAARRRADRRALRAAGRDGRARAARRRGGLGEPEPLPPQLGPALPRLRHRAEPGVLRHRGRAAAAGRRLPGRDAGAEAASARRSRSARTPRRCSRPSPSCARHEGELAAVPYTEAYREQMQPIAAELARRRRRDDRSRGGAAASPTSAPPRRRSEDNDWEPADEAWAAHERAQQPLVRAGRRRTRSTGSPCSHKAGFHLTFALIDQGSLELAGPAHPAAAATWSSRSPTWSSGYEARDVSFHLPDFIEHRRQRRRRPRRRSARPSARACPTGARWPKRAAAARWR